MAFPITSCHASLNSLLKELSNSPHLIAPEKSLLSIAQMQMIPIVSNVLKELIIKTACGDV